MKLLTKEIQKKLPPLYTNENKSPEDTKIIVKFFCPWGKWTWYATEWDQEDRFYGYIVGDFPELGYFSLRELESVRGPFGLKIERDLYYGYDHTLAEVMTKAVAL